MKSIKAIALVTGGFMAGFASVLGAMYGLHWLESKIAEEELNMMTERYANFEGIKVGGSE